MGDLDQLPERGYGVLRGVPDHLVIAYWLAGYIKAQYVPGLPGVYQARLTGAGRNYRKRVRDDNDHIALLNF